MKKFFFIILIPLILFSSTSYSKTMYVTDILYIMARRQPGLDFKIVDQLSSNERVNLLRSEESWARGRKFPLRITRQAGCLKDSLLKKHQRPSKYQN